jgi:hypothetical protein
MSVNTAFEYPFLRTAKNAGDCRNNISIPWVLPKNQPPAGKPARKLSWSGRESLKMAGDYG